MVGFHFFIFLQFLLSIAWLVTVLNVNHAMDIITGVILTRENKLIQCDISAIHRRCVSVYVHGSRRLNSNLLFDGFSTAFKQLKLNFNQISKWILRWTESGRSCCHSAKSSNLHLYPLNNSQQFNYCSHTLHLLHWRSSYAIDKPECGRRRVYVRRRLSWIYYKLQCIILSANTVNNLRWPMLFRCVRKIYLIHVVVSRVFIRRQTLSANDEEMVHSVWPAFIFGNSKSDVLCW